MDNIVHLKGNTNIDDLLDEYNELKRQYEETGDESYKRKMELHLGIMKGATTSFTIKAGPKHYFD